MNEKNDTHNVRFVFPPPAQPSSETAVIFTKEDAHRPTMWSELPECPNCHVNHPRTLPVRCERCGNELVKSTCKTCGYNFSPIGARVPQFCKRCGCEVKHSIKTGFSAERVMGMFGGFSMVFAITFRDGADQRVRKLRGDTETKVNELFVLARTGCNIERCKMSNGAVILFFYPKGPIVSITPDQLQALDSALRDADMGYLMGKEETILAEKTLMGVVAK